MRYFILLILLIATSLVVAGNSVGGSQDGTSGDNTGQNRPVYDPAYSVLYIPEVQSGDVIVKGVSMKHIGEYKGYQFFVLEK